MINSKLRSVAAATFLGLVVISGSAQADMSKLDQIKNSLAAFTGVQYSMMGDIVYLHGTSDAIPELGNIVAKLMEIEGIAEVRSNIFKK